MLSCFSSFSSLFVSDLFPRGGDEIKVGIAVCGNPARVRLMYDSYTGLAACRAMEPGRAMGKATMYEADMPIFRTSEKIRYYFVVDDENDVAFYYSKSGLGRRVPSVKERFEIIPDLDAPEWIGNSTCYQIFPDRFMNGDPSNDVKAGAYEFDGAWVTTPSFDEDPKSFEDARCIDFYNGDLKGIEMKLGYLKDLGFNAIYLNPVNASRTVHRFDSVDFFHVDDKLGGDKAYEELLAKAHSMGIRIIQDISINHTGSDHPWYRKAEEDPSSEEASFYYRKSDGSFRCWAGVKTLPQLNYNSQKLRDRIYRDPDSAMQKYLKAPYYLDAWRLDVAPELARTEEDQMCREVWREVRACLKPVRNQLYLVGEGWDDSSDYMQGDMWDATMNYYGSGRIIRSWLGEEDRFLQDGWGHSPRKTVPFTASDFICAVKAAIDSVPDQSVYFQMNLIDSHDTPRLHNNDEIMDDDLYLGGILALYMLPGMPNIYYGDEIKLRGTMGSVEGSRFPMEWDESKWNRKYLEWHRTLGKVRSVDGFGYSPFRMVEAGDGCLLMMRYLEDRTYVAIVNRGPDAEIELCDEFATQGTLSTVLGTAEIVGSRRIRLKMGQSALLVDRR